ncbi:MAG: MFS transporter [Anaerolineales bacterium]|nr:MFS transporter [Anaerolineales bacterium]
MKHDQAVIRAIHILGFGIAASLLGDGTLMTVLPQAAFSSQLTLTLNMVAWALAVNRIVRLGFNPMAGRLLQRFPRRAVLIPAMGLGGISTLLCSLGGFGWVMAGRALWGLAWAGLWVGGTTVVLDLSNGNNRGRLNGLFQMWFFIGVGSSSFLGAWLADQLGLKAALVMSAVLMMLVCLMWAVLLPETGDHRKQSDDPPKRFWRDEAVLKAVAVASLPMFVNRFLFAGMIAVTVILWLETYIGEGVQMMGVFIPLATMAGAFAASRTLISMFSTPYTGRLSDRMGRRWPAMTAVLAMGALGCGLMSISSFPLAVFGLLLSSVTSGSIQTLLSAWIGDTVLQERQENVVGALFSVGDVGSAIGPIAGLTWIQHYSIPALYQLSAIILILGAGYSIIISSKSAEAKRDSAIPRS